MNHKIDFIKNQSESEVDDDVWEVVVTQFSSVSNLNMSQYSYFDELKTGHLNEMDFYKVKTRFNPLINKNMRMKLGDEFFDIKKIINKNFKNQYLIIIANKIS